MIMIKPSVFLYFHFSILLSHHLIFLILLGDVKDEEVAEAAKWLDPYALANRGIFASYLSVGFGLYFILTPLTFYMVRNSLDCSIFFLILKMPYLNKYCSSVNYSSLGFLMPLPSLHFSVYLLNINLTARSTYLLSLSISLSVSLFLTLSLSPFIQVDELNATASQQAMVTGLLSLPWALKIGCGFLSDSFPIGTENPTIYANILNYRESLGALDCLHMGSHVYVCISVWHLSDICDEGSVSTVVYTVGREGVYISYHILDHLPSVRTVQK
jgi:hypothetical protein